MVKRKTTLLTDISIREEIKQRTGMSLTEFAARRGLDYISLSHVIHGRRRTAGSGSEAGRCYAALESIGLSRASIDSPHVEKGKQ